MPILLIGSFLLFTDLNERAVFGDEGNTAYMAMSCGHYGAPIPGRLYPPEWSTQFGSIRLLTLHPWTDVYLGTLGITLFGQTAGGLRAPFAFVGVIFYLLLFYLAKRVFPDPRAVIILMTLAMFSFPLYVYLRGARYYAPLLAFTVASAILWIDLIRRPQALTMTLLVLSNLLVSFSFWPFGLVMNGLMIVHFLATKDRRNWWLALPGFLTALFFYVAVRQSQYDVQGIYPVSLADRAHGILFLLVEMNRDWLPVWALASLAFLKPRSRTINFFLAVSFAYFVALSTGAFFAVRYAIPAFVLLLIGYTAVLARLWALKSIFARSVVVLLIVSNLGGVISWRLLDIVIRVFPDLTHFIPSSMTWGEAMGQYGEIKWPAGKILCDFANPYYGSTEGAVSFLTQHARPGDGVIVQELQRAYVFHLPKLHFFENLATATANDANVHWVIPNQYRASRPHEVEVIRQQWRDWARTRGFVETEIPAPDVFYGNPWPDEYPLLVPNDTRQLRIWSRPK